MKQKPTAFTQSFSVAAAVILSAAPARAVLFDSTGDPAFNTTAPTGALAGSGWQYQGNFGGFLATPIAPNYFLAAKHIGASAGATLSYSGNVFVTDSFVDSGNSDLRIWHVTTAFSTYAPLYTGSNVTGRDLVFFGRGNERGADVTLSGNLIGWLWSGGPNLQRWGTNTVTGKVDLGATYGSTIFAEFNHGASATEATYSAGDSSGGLFIQDPADSQWKLAGINFAVTGPFATNAAGTGAFDAALFDMRGLYAQDAITNAYTLVTGADPVPSGLYATDISANLPFILSVVPEPSSSCALLAGIFTLASLRRRRLA